MSDILPFCQVKLQYLLDRVLDQSLDDNAFRVAACLALTHADHDTGECHPSYETIGTALGRHAKSVTLAKGADIVMREVLMSGEVERGALPGLLGVSDRQARKVTAELLALGALKSDTQRAPIRLSVPARLPSDWMPGLFPER